MSIDIHRRAKAGIKSIGWNLGVWTKVGQRPISRFQDDANLGRQLGAFDARSVASPDRRSGSGLDAVLGQGRKCRPISEAQDSMARSGDAPLCDSVEWVVNGSS